MIALTTTKTVKKFMSDLKNAGCDTKEDYQAGTVIAKDGDKTVYKAIQKGHNGHWLVKYENSDNIKFN